MCVDGRHSMPVGIDVEVGDFVRFASKEGRPDFSAGARKLLATYEGILFEVVEIHSSAFIKVHPLPQELQQIDLRRISNQELLSLECISWNIEYFDYADRRKFEVDTSFFDSDDFLNLLT